MKSFTSNRGSQFGDFVTKKGSLYKPRDKGATTFIPYPAFSKGKPIPTLDAEGEIEDWVVEVDLAEFVGTRSYSFLAAPLGNQAHPYTVFQRAMHDYVESHPRSAPSNWMRWLGKKAEGDLHAPRPCLKPPRSCLLIQGMLLEHSGKTLEEPKDHIIQMVPPSAKPEFLAEVKPGGVFEKVAEGMSIKITAHEGKNRSGRAMTMYSVEPGKRVKLDMEAAARLWIPWEDILNLEEDPAVVINRLVETFDARSVVFAFREHMEYCKYLTPELIERAEAQEREESGQAAPAAPAQAAPAPARKVRRPATPVVVYEDEDGDEHPVDEDEVPEDLKPVAPVKTAPANPAEETIEEKMARYEREMAAMQAQREGK